MGFNFLSYISGLYPESAGGGRGGEDDGADCAQPPLDADADARARGARPREEPAAATHLPRHSKAPSSDQVGEKMISIYASLR